MMGGAPTVQAGLGLVATSRLEALDLYGIPYSVADAEPTELGRLSVPDGPSLYWWSGDGAPCWATLQEIPVFAPIAPEDRLDRLARSVGARWEPCAEIRDRAGAVVGTVRLASDGSVLLPFDPGRAAATLLDEQYLALTSGGRARMAKSLARRTYYRARPLLPRRTQMALRRRFAAVQQRATFPAWPTETALHDLREWLLAVVQHIAGTPLPQIHWWPGEARWAMVLTHDVERAGGYGYVEELAALEAAQGLRSAWYFVPERDYRVDDALVARLRAAGLEVCVHGLHHDGRDLQPGVFEERLPTMRAYAERWGSVGFRAPSTQRSYEVISALGCDHDSSYSDVARFEPQGGGSCSWLPYFVGEVVELPITMPMDHTLFELLGHQDGHVWVEKAAFLRERGGMGMLLTHPDYLRDDANRAVYASFLAHLAVDQSAWHALPWEVSQWWRRRTASRIEGEVGRWVVEGPAAGALVVSIDRPAPFP